uniref:PQ-loop repeat-containing protein n=1 Tax=viral metagenome TaxID=1070528 RepID=A0A6C0AHA8_9ZZZZ
MTLQISDIIGLIGTFFLIIRLLPLIRDQIIEPSKINLTFILLEFIACIFLGTSAFLINSIPFIVANILSFINLSIIIYIQIKLRISNENKENNENNENNEIIVIHV